MNLDPPNKSIIIILHLILQVSYSRCLVPPLKFYYQKQHPPFHTSAICAADVFSIFSILIVVIVNSHLNS